MMLGFILAGGQSSRMGGIDKAIVPLGNKRLIDHVVERLNHQVEKLFLVAPEDRGTGLPLIADAEDFAGPVGGIFGIADHIAEHERSSRGFITCPADAPNFPPDLVSKLASEPGRSAIARDEIGFHPIFGYWNMTALQSARGNLSSAPAIRQVCDHISSRTVTWPGKDLFVNINTVEDLERARTLFSTRFSKS